MVANEAVRYILNKYHLDDLGDIYPIAINDSRSTGLLGLFKEFNYKIGVEVGVEEGIFSEEICKAVPDITIHSIDSWAAYSADGAPRGQRKAERHYGTAINRLSAYPNCHVLKKFSAEAILQFEDQSIDFVYIDGNHTFDYVITDIIKWSKKVKSGGIVSGHDYKKSTDTVLFHIIEATNVYTSAHKISPWFMFTDFYRRKTAPSWMWVKP